MTSPFTDEELRAMAEGGFIVRSARLPDLARELLETRKDARRYRWLRDASLLSSPTPYIAHNIYDNGKYVETIPLFGEKCDQWIDTAMREGK